ncbi:mago-binding domain-containing protein [Sporobolomyces koalae]|uniref:mago-binding domain-containing protein n=1 Tax=Sporobolomyces koalae TaxID=500713 RepID=UPI00317EFD61
MSRGVPMNLIFPDRSNSGISKNHDGQRVIAASRRPDGSLRQEIKIRPGFTPQEDVTLFRSQKQLELDHHRQTKGTVPGLRPNPLVQQALANVSGSGASQGKSARRNAAKRNKDKQDGESTRTAAATTKVKDSWDDEEDESPSSAAVESTVPTASTTMTTTTTTTTETAPTEDPAKRLRNLKKKLKQTQQLQDKVQAGTNLEPAERDKLDKLEQLEAEIAKLELS